MASTGYAYEDSRVSGKDGAEVADGRAAAFRPPNPRENRRPKRAPLHYERGGRGSVERRLRENPRSIPGPQSSILNPQSSILNSGLPSAPPPLLRRHLFGHGRFRCGVGIDEAEAVHRIAAGSTEVLGGRCEQGEDLICAE